MNTEFEMVAFELEEERGGRRGGAARAPRPSSGRTWPAKPRAPRRPAWGGGWRYPVLAPWPEPYGEPYREPYRAPYPAAAPDDEPQDEPQDEGPKTIKPALRQMPSKERPKYKPLGLLRDAVRTMGPGVAGLYLIEFDADGRKRAYSGQSDNVRRRLQQHLLCATMMGLDVAGHKVFVAVSDKSDAQRRQIEKDLHAKMADHTKKVGKDKQVLTNQRTELEAELLGEFWG
ncbi:GIY-YIG nuclease family protein [Massilia pseudoviolaceinigra]|uniref:GIY-YIG nuclease family protein n=1 Tax=Massilia pseudoviolaceinigra TaxID=3057165 RepID=UPI0027968533|nr:GIY-YIG nuclease family protein [Massilia sp. CCM 9206]MDQ1918885.1 hypothetical protein [Massilia sp. CCM 9206]